MTALSVSESAASFPAIETWWGYLTPGARHALIATPEEELAPRVRDEIERATGMALSSRTHLSEDDRRFLAEQDEEAG